MAKLREPERPVPETPVLGVRDGGGIRANLVAHWRHAANGRVTPQTVRADRLERGEVVVVQGWQLGPFRPSRVPLYGCARVESDGSLTPVYPLIFVGYHVIGGVKYGERHAVDYEPVGADGDITEIRIDLDEVRRLVDDPENWATGRNVPQPPPNAA